MLGSKPIAGCQRQPPRGPASSGAGPAASKGLGEAAVCLCKAPSRPSPPAAVTGARQLPRQDVPNMPFLPFRQSYPLTREQGTVQSGSPSTAIPAGVSSCATCSKEGFSSGSCGASKAP